MLYPKDCKQFRFVTVDFLLNTILTILQYREEHETFNNAHLYSHLKLCKIENPGSLRGFLFLCFKQY